MNDSFPLIAGLLAAMLHVITGPDHLAAVMPFVIETKKKAWKIGLYWGIGHIVGMMGIGLLFVLFKEIIHVETISNYSEQLVGIVLVFIGIWAFYKIFKTSTKHKHLHFHDGNHPMIHKHDHHHHNGTKNHQHTHEKPTKQSHFASFSIGILHGLAGIAHFILFIPILGFDSKISAFIYILGFATGIILAMTAFAFVVSRIASYTKQEHNETFFKGIRLAAGLFAIVIGVYWFFKF